MKFTLKSMSSSTRLGLITNLPRLPEVELETPLALLYTKGGAVPHLTPDVTEMVTKQNLGLHIPISHVTHIQDRMQLYKSNIAKFIGMNEYLTYCSFIDPGEKKKEGYSETNKVSVWTRFGRKPYSAKSYMELIEALKPDMFLTLADGEACNRSSQKKNQKTFSNTMKFFDECVEFYQKSITLKESQMIGAVEGGFDLKLREQCSELIAKGPIFGVVIDGFHDYSESTLEMKFSEIKPILEASLKHIPYDKLRIIHGCWNPSVLLDLVEFGIDMFDSSYPYIITEKFGALVFPNDDSIISQCQSNVICKILKSSNQILPHSYEQEFEDPPPKKHKLMTSSKYYTSLLDVSNADDFGPILHGCSCLTCRNHTRSYIHHLTNVKELLGPTLLMIHNMHHYLQFLSLIRKSLSNGTFNQLKVNFQAWADSVDQNGIVEK